MIASVSRTATGSDRSIEANIAEPSNSTLGVHYAISTTKGHGVDQDRWMDNGDFTTGALVFPCFDCENSFLAAGLRRRKRLLLLLRTTQDVLYFSMLPVSVSKAGYHSSCSFRADQQVDLHVQPNACIVQKPLVDPVNINRRAVKISML